jgi:hypothetical protein
MTAPEDRLVFAGVMMVIAVIVAAIMLAIGLKYSHARQGPQWAQADEGTRDWFRGLHNDYGTNCCDVSDGNRLDDIDWRQDASGDDGEPRYSVKLGGQWWPVDPKKVLHGNNRVGYAILWRPQIDDLSGYTDGPPMYCFMPGATT